MTSDPSAAPFVPPVTAEGRFLSSFRSWAITEGGWAPATCTVQLRQLVFLHDEFGLPLGEGFAYDGALDVLAERRARGASVWAYNTDVKALNKVLAWPRLGGDDRRFRKLPVPPGEFRARSEGEVRALLNYTHPDPEINRFRRGLLSFVFYAGLRGGEYPMQDRDEVDFDTLSFEVNHTTKRGRKRVLPLEGWLAQRTRPFRAAVEARDSLVGAADVPALWVVNYGGHGWRGEVRRVGVDSLRVMLNKIGHEVLGETFNATEGRHTVALDMVQREVPLTGVQYWLGHHRIDTTATYAKVRSEHVFEMMRRNPRRDPYKGLKVPE